MKHQQSSSGILGDRSGSRDVLQQQLARGREKLTERAIGRGTELAFDRGDQTDHDSCSELVAGAKDHDVDVSARLRRNESGLACWVGRQGVLAWGRCEQETGVGESLDADALGVGRHVGGWRW